jgi:class 3 adenylate cyclase
VSHGPVRSARDGDARFERGASIDELLDRAVAAINRGDRPAATALAGQVLAVDSANAEAEDLLAAPSDPGEIRRLTIFFADLVDSTVLSSRVEPETYRLLVGRYREQVLRIVNRYEGHIGSTKGDGLLAVFGYPIAHEDDVRRAVQAGLEITREVSRLSEQARRRFGIEISVRVGVHRGLVYLDTAQDRARWWSLMR